MLINLKLQLATEQEDQVDCVSKSKVLYNLSTMSSILI
jgi:hypothetical protein